MIHSKSLRCFKVFSSHMVLQRERAIVISGRGEPGKMVHAVFADTSAEGKVGRDGVWSVTFPAMNAGGPYTFRAGYAGQKATIAFEDILVGEVWMCTGQSNMAMPVLSPSPFWQTFNAEEELKHADHPQLRFFNAMLIRRLAPEGPLEDAAGGSWEPCNAESAAKFSACGYFFGRRLQADLDVPVGLVATAWGGTEIEAWISKEKFEELHLVPQRDTPAAVAKAQKQLSKGLAVWLEKFDRQGKPDPKEFTLDFDDSSWECCKKAGYVLPTPGRWVFRRTFNLPRELEGKAFDLELGIVNDMDHTYLNGKLIGATGQETSEYWNVNRCYHVPAGLARAGKNCLAIVADNHYGSGSVNLTDPHLICGKSKWTVSTENRSKNTFLLNSDFPIRPTVPGLSLQHSPASANYPSTLFNGILFPWFRYTFRGVIWYQGCQNNGQNSYYLFHKMLIDDLRARWHDPEMPFLLVQLAAFFQHRPEHPVDSDQADALPFPEFSPYALTREIQAEIPRTRAHVGLVTAFDRGNASDVHPRDKQTVGLRLALKAESMLGFRAKLTDGPEFDGLRFEKNKIRVFFRNTGSGLTTTDGQPPRGFALGDRNGLLVHAKATISGNTVVVSSPLVQEPQRVRYAFTGFCKVNLTNQEGFPALPFRSDKPDYTAMFKEE